jgi:hypothetical protein
VIKFKEINQSDLILDMSISPEDYPLEDYFYYEAERAESLKEECKHNVHAWCKMTLKGTLRDNPKFFCVAEVRCLTADSYSELMDYCYEDDSKYQIAIDDIISDINRQMTDMFLFLTGRIEKQGHDS